MNNTVNEVDWVAQGKFWASVHPRVKRMAVEYFTIPQELEFELLPSPHLSIAKMLDFPLPLQNNIITATQPAQFFSINRPDITVTTNFKVTEDGGFTQAGDAELPDTAVEEEEEETSEPEVRGRGQRKNIAAHRYLGPARTSPKFVFTPLRPPEIEVFHSSDVTVTTFNLFSSQASVTRHLNFRS
ncbi:hypothetical protein B0H14DRAFT_3614416 [Mycena olivaceomarginata]|nr:hypothetical protein B0H14DRAFT_3614416 [Mycena olivaceomarginata]